MKLALLAPAGAMHRYDGLFHKNLHYAPITLALLAALVPPELGAEIAIYDETAHPIPLDLEADIVGITCITGTAGRCYRFADHFRSRGIRVILGGVHPSLMPEEAGLHADSVVVGLGEDSFPRALRDHAAGRLQRLYRQEEATTIRGRPLPRKDLLDRKRYITLNTVEAVRGCCHSCAFCAYPQAFGKNVHTRAVDEIVEEIRTLKGKFVVFPDVNMISDLTFARELFTALIPLKKWWFGLSTTLVGQDPELMDLLRASGCKGLLIGFESVNQESQTDMHKGMNAVAGYRALMRNLHRRGIMVMGCFAFGSDGDDKDVFERTVALCDRIKIDLPRFAVITPFPRTPFYEELEAQGRIVERNWALYDVEHVVFEPKRMMKGELEQGIARAWAAAYGIGSILRRIDFRNLPSINLLFAVYLAANIGYRKYARHYRKFDEAAMADNSDIPLPVSATARGAAGAGA